MSNTINQAPGIASILYTVAAKEFRDCVRGRWLGVGAVLFTVLSLAIVYGTAAIGGTLDFRDLPVAMNSLVSLTVFLLPLLALLISADAFVGEEESGTLLLMLTYPMSRTEWLIGKLAGQGAALLAALVLGYLPLMLFSVFGFLPYAPADLAEELFTLCSSGWLLGLTTTLAAFCVSLSVSSKARALGVLLLIWLLLVLLYDLGLLVGGRCVGQNAHAVPGARQSSECLPSFESDVARYHGSRGAGCCAYRYFDRLERCALCCCGLSYPQTVSVVI